MANDLVIQKVWLGLLDRERESRYYTYLGNRYQKLHFRLSTIVALGSTGAVASLLVGMPDVVSGCVSLVVAVCAIWSVFSDYSRKSVEAAILGKEYSLLYLEWEQLWIELNALDDEQIATRLKQLDREAIEIGKNSPYRLVVNKKLNERCAREAYDVVKHEFAA